MFMKYFILQAFTFFDSRLGIALFAFFHQGVDDKGLVVFVQLFFDQGISAFAFTRVEYMGIDRLTTCGHFVHHGQFKVTVNRQGQ